LVLGKQLSVSCLLRVSIRKPPPFWNEGTV